MFVSAGLDLQIHSSTPSGVENLQVQYPPSTAKIVKVSICNDNSYIAVLRENEKPQIFSAKDRQNVRLIHTINVSNISALSFKHTTKKIIAMGTTTGDVIMYDTKGRMVANIFNKIMDSVKVLEFTCDDKQLCGFDGSTFFVFPEINANSHLKRYKQQAECCFLRCHPFIMNRVVLGCTNGHVGVWDVQNGVELVHLENSKAPITGLAMSSCGNFLIVAEKNLKLYNIDYTASTTSFQYDLVQEKPVSSLDLSTDDKLLAVGLNDGTLKIYNVKEQLKQIYSNKLHDTSIEIIAFENIPREINTNFVSFVKHVEESKVNDVGGTPRSTHGREKAIKNVKTDHRDENVERMKRSLMKLVRAEMDCLENQLNEHCVKFQKFLDNEFETIDTIIKKKWDIFNAGDMNQIIKAICPEEAREGAG